MKKRALFLAMVAALVTFAACNKEADTQITEGNSIEAVFEVSAPELATKAISDGLTATKLFFYLYDKNGDLLFETNSAVESPAYPVTFNKLEDKKWSVKVRLIKDMDYQVVFWAQKPEADAFTLDAAAKTLSVNYSNMTLNADDEDAFWGTTGVFTVTGPATKVVTLKRPFAQLNVAIPEADLNVAAFTLGKYSKTVAGITTQYTITGTVPTTMALLDGTVSGNAASTAALALTAAAQPNVNITVGGETYKHLAMAYVLVGDKVTNDVTLTVDTKAEAIGTAGVLTRSILNVPLQRNYRTNIVGSIFSVEEEFTVTVDNEFGETGTGAYGDVNVPDYVPTYATIAELNTALAGGVNAVALDMSSVSGTINLPNTTDNIYLYILNDLSADGNVLNVVYTEGAAAHPANLYIYAKDLNTLNGTVPDTHVEIYSYSHIGTGVMETSGTTLVIQPFAFYGNLVIKKGGLKVEGKIQVATLSPVSATEVINVTIIKDATEQINGQIETLNVTAGITSVSTEDTQGGVPTVDPAAAEEDKPAVGTMTVSGGAATVEENSTVTTVNQSGTGTVSIDEDAEVDVVEAEDPSKITGKGAEEVEFLIKSEAQLTAAVEAKVANMTIGENFTCERGYELDFDTEIDLNNCEITFNGVKPAADNGVAEYFPDSRAFKVIGAAVVTIKNGTIRLNDALVGSVYAAGTGKLYLKDYISYNCRNFQQNVLIDEESACDLDGVTIYATNAGGGIYCAGLNNSIKNCNVYQSDNNSTPFRDWHTCALSTSSGKSFSISEGHLEARDAVFIFSSGGRIDISGGEFVGRRSVLKAENNNWESGYAGGSRLYVSGGTFNGPIYISGWGKSTPPPVAALTISGGTFTNSTNDTMFHAANGTISITGGTFSEDPSAYVPAGYQAVLTDGKYVVDAIPEVDYDGISGLTKKAGTFEVSTPAAFNHVLSTSAILKPASKQVTIKLTQDIDLTNQEKHTLNNLNGASYVVTLDGQGHTLKGLQEELFSEAVNGAVINVKNLTFDTVNISKSDDKYVAVIMGYADCNGGINVSNVTFKNVTLVGAKHIGVVYGYGAGWNRQNDGPVFMDSTIDGCTFENCSLATNEGSAGVVAGHVAGNEWTLHTLKNSTIKGCTVICNEANKAGVLFGTIGVAGTLSYGKTGGTYVQDCLWFNNSVTAAGSAVLRSFGRVTSPGGKYYIDGNLVAYNEGNGDVVSGDIYEKTE